MKNIIIKIILLALLMIACGKTIKKIPNPQKGQLVNTLNCEITGERRFLLDSISAPKPIYIQLLQEHNYKYLTFLNEYNSSIYFYDYSTTKFIKKIDFASEMSDIIKPSGYYISNDSLFILDRAKMNLVIFVNNKVIRQIALKDNKSKDWPNNYPQYLLSTINPISKIGDDLLLVGQLFWSIPQNKINNFYFTAYIDVKQNKVRYYHRYPQEIYGDEANWEGGLFTSVFYTISPMGKMVLSFPPSHHLYITDFGINNTYKKVCAASNNANTIFSIDYSNTKNTPSEISMKSYIEQDVYGAILYDSFRQVYYRFVLDGVSDTSTGTLMQKKMLSIIVMDKDFKYLGESKIGLCSEWNWKNSFVTSEGLNIEYNTSKNFDESYLIFKIFTFKKK